MSITVCVPGQMKCAPRAWQLISVICELPKEILYRPYPVPTTNPTSAGGIFAIWQHLSKAAWAALTTFAPVSIKARERICTPLPLSDTNTALVWVEPTSTPAAILIVTSHTHRMPAGEFGMGQGLEKCIDAISGLGFRKVARVFQI